MACLNKLHYVRGVYSSLKRHCRPTDNEHIYRIQVLSNRQVESKTSSRTEHSQCDLIGPPHPESNLRPIRYFVPVNEQPIERKLRLKRTEVQKWNQDFWTAHNTKFIKERKEFMAANQSHTSETPLSADEMSVFYKAFLDKTWRTHFHYNLEWYKKNAELVLLDLRVKMFQLWRYLKLVKRS